jgi:hypothetical protein
LNYLDSRKNLLYADAGLPIGVVVEYGEADCAAREYVGMEEAAAAGVTRVDEGGMRGCVAWQAVML